MSSNFVFGGYLRDEAAEKLVQPVFEESLGAQRKSEIQAITVEFLDSTGSDHDSSSKTVFYYVESKEERIDKGGSQPVVFRRGEGEKVDVLGLRVWVSADYRTVG